MHILFLTENFPPERYAIASRVYERACYWIRWGHKVTVLTCVPNFPEGKIYKGYHNKWYQVEYMDGIRVVRTKTFITPNEGFYLRTLDFMSYMVTAFFAGLFQKGPDVIVATSPQFFAAVGGWALAKVRYVPFILELSDLWPASITAVGLMNDNVIIRWIEKFELFLYCQAASIVVLTESFKENLISRGIRESKISVILNGVDISRYEPRPRDDSLSEQLGLKGCFVVGYIGTLGMAHALENVLNSAENLRDFQNIRFLFVGTGAARRALIEETNRRKLKNVVFVPSQPKARISAYWSICDVSLIHLKNTPLFKTVIPSKIFESMGVGLPLLLAAPKGEASKIVEEENTGMWVPPENPEALSDAIIILKKDKERLRQFAVHSRKASSSYSRKSQAKNMLAVLERVIT